MHVLDIIFGGLFISKESFGGQGKNVKLKTVNKVKENTNLKVQAKAHLPKNVLTLS